MKLQYIMAYLLFKFIGLFPLALLQRTANIIAYCLYFFQTSFFRTTRINIELAYPNLKAKQHEKLVKKSIQCQCQSYIECIKFWSMSNTYNLKRIQKVHNSHILENAIQSPQGTIIVVPHLGSWELLNAWLCQQTQPMIMYKPNKNKAINRYILKARQNTNAILVPADETGIRAIFKHLKQGGTTLILPDHTPKASGGIYADFFGQHVLTGTIVPKLAQKTGSHVIGMNCLRINDSAFFEIHCSQLHDLILSKDLNESVSYLNQHIEASIALAPEQYIWSYKRFKHCQGHRNLYKPQKTAA